MEFKIPFSGRAHNYTDEEKAVVLKAMDGCSSTNTKWR
jgi:hypothetical protein